MSILNPMYVHVFVGFISHGLLSWDAGRCVPCCMCVLNLAHLCKTCGMCCICKSSASKRKSRQTHRRCSAFGVLHEAVWVQLRLQVYCSLYRKITFTCSASSPLASFCKGRTKNFCLSKMRRRLLASKPCTRLWIPFSSIRSTAFRCLVLVRRSNWSSVGMTSKFRIRFDFLRFNHCTCCVGTYLYTSTRGDGRRLAADTTRVKPRETCR
jgi:hypothetical protein